MDYGNPYRNIDSEDEPRREFSRRGAGQLTLRLTESEIRQAPKEVTANFDNDAAPRDAAHLALFRLGNPYATHYFFPDGELADVQTVAPTVAVEPVQIRAAGLSKQAFRRICVSIFRQYMPKLESGRLRPHHREFIARNESRSPSIRRALVDQLEKYSLSAIPGLVPQFNREDDVFTEAKLRKIEEIVGPDRE